MRTTLVLLVLLGLAAPVPASELGDLLGDAGAARDFDYCGWVHERGGRNADVPDVDRILADKAADVMARAAAGLVHVGVAVSRESETRRDCEKTFQRGRERFDKTLAKELRAVKKRGGFDRSDDAEIARAQEAITDFWIQDQAGRRTYVTFKAADKTGHRYWARQLSASHGKLIDTRATALLMRLLDTYDWIDIQRFGSAVSAHAWLLAQHADDRPEFQALVLGRMEPLLDGGGVKPANYAYLWDRVAVNTGRKQRYGTQPIWDCRDGKLELQPLEDPQGVNERRRVMGLGSVEQGLEQMARTVCK